MALTVVPRCLVLTPMVLPRHEAYIVSPMSHTMLSMIHKCVVLIEQPACLGVSMQELHLVIPLSLVQLLL